METLQTSVPAVDNKESKMADYTNIKVLDCTIRDGGLINDFNFSDQFVKVVYDTCVEAGIDYMEIGYKASKKIFSPDGLGIWKFCNENDIRRILGENNSNLKLSVMADAGRTDYHEDILPKSQSIIDLVRVACYAHQLSEAIDIIKDAHDKGYETTINIMAVSKVNETELYNAMDILAETEVDVIYLVDSFGSLYSEDIQKLLSIYLKYAQKAGKKVGIHAHNNQQLAYANTINAINLGAGYIDATISGLGRGAGNCPMELILGYLKNPKYCLRPVIECIENHITTLKSQINWGFDIPYMLTGQFNQHPRSAISFVTDNRSDYTKFYDTIVNGD